MKKFKIVKYILIVILSLLIFPMMLYLYLSPVKSSKVSYGLNFSNKYAQELNLDWKKTFDEILLEIPTKKYRLAVYWDEVQKDPNSYDYSNIKYQLNALEKYPESEVILVFGRKVIRYPECHEPKWWQEVREDSAKKEALLKYMDRTVSELKNYRSIKYWQVENEAMFPFGTCTPLSNLSTTLKEEVEIVRNHDSRKVLIQDSGEGGFWIPSSKIGDFLGISMYRKVWFDLFGMMTSNSFPLKYPLGPAFYKIKAFLLGIPMDRIKATEVQAEPWGPVRNYILRQDEVDLTMSRSDFEGVFEFTKESGFEEFHLWGVEWWYHMKKEHNNNFYWDTAISKIGQK
jgi:hypothetical protein